MMTYRLHFDDGRIETVEAPDRVEALLLQDGWPEHMFVFAGPGVGWIEYDITQILEDDGRI